MFKERSAEAVMKITPEAILALENFIRHAIAYQTWNVTKWSKDDRDDLYALITARLLKAGEIKGRYGQKSLKSFIWKVTQGVCVDFHRKKRRALFSHLDENRKEPKSLEGAADCKTDNSLVETIEELKKSGILIKHEQILLDRIDGLSRSEIAKKHGLSESQVKGHLEYAKRKLAREWRRHEARRRLRELSSPRSFRGR
jgi:RNA polymerase sigma factor (sigma-70 family)